MWGESEIITEVERRWRVVQHHLLHCDGGLDAHKRPSVNDLRLDLLDSAENHPSCVAAVQSAFAFLDQGSVQAPEDVGRMSAECVSYLTDPVRACGSPLAVGLTHCGLVAGYVLAVAGCVALRRDPWPAAQISALRLPRASRVLRHLQPEALCAATALTVHGQAGSSQSSLSADMLLSSASPRQIVTAAHVGAEADVRPG